MKQMIKEIIKRRILSAYYDGFNQAHYSHVHPEQFETKSCESAGAEYWEKNKEYILASFQQIESKQVSAEENYNKKIKLWNDIADFMNEYVDIIVDKERGIIMTDFIACRLHEKFASQLSSPALDEEGIKSLAKETLNKHIASEIFGYFGKLDTENIISAMVEMYKLALSSKGKEETIVRHNLMTEEGYSPFCGNIGSRFGSSGCHNPKTQWDENKEQFVCGHCGWVSSFPKDFIERYKQKWNIKTNQK